MPKFEPESPSTSTSVSSFKIRIRGYTRHYEHWSSMSTVQVSPQKEFEKMFGIRYSDKATSMRETGANAGRIEGWRKGSVAIII
jgi:hypothetical protein